MGYTYNYIGICVLMGIGAIAPEVSASFMLMAVGGYETVLEGIISVDIIFMLPVVIGFGVSLFALGDGSFVFIFLSAMRLKWRCLL